MNEFEFNNEDETEIERIQKEIYNDLSKDYEGDIARDRDLESAFKEAESIIEVSKEEPISTMREPEISVNNQFYSETVKNEKNKLVRSRFKKAVALVCIASILGGASIGIASAAANKFIFKTQQSTETEKTAPKNFSFEETTVPVAVSPDATAILDDFSAIVDSVEASVVGITSVNTLTYSSKFFSPSSRELQAQGSGIIFDDDGEKVYIVTNHHVVESADSVYVSVYGSDVVPAYPMGNEANLDLAVIYILKEDLQEVGVNNVVLARFGDSDSLKVGNVVLAIGNALGEGNTATMGLISAKNKEIYIPSSEIELNVLQTDAAINPGNSGGPLINTKGEVIGINTARLKDSEVEGIGYSIASNVAKPIIEEIRNQEHNQKPFLGVLMDNLDEETAAMYNLPAMGVLIVKVVEGSPAEAGGIFKGDIVTGFNGKPIITIEDLSSYVSECNVGDEVEVKIFRSGEGSITLNLVLSTAPAASSF